MIRTKKSINVLLITGLVVASTLFTSCDTPNGPSTGKSVVRTNPGTTPSTLKEGNTWFSTEVTGLSLRKITKITFQTEPYEDAATSLKSWSASENEGEITAYLVNDTEVIVSANYHKIIANKNSDYMFGNDSALTYGLELRVLEGLNLIDTSEVTSMLGMFRNCKNLESLDLSNFNTKKVETMYEMFQNCQSLKSLDLTSFNTANVDTMAKMFEDCDDLEELKLTSFNTSNVDNMVSMFDECGSLTTLDLGSFNTNKVERMKYMFKNCHNLETIYASGNFGLDSSYKSIRGDEFDKDMFEGCTSLTGGNGTEFSSSQVDSEYARIDTSSKPGYFTSK